jgi:hypothetical protein
VLTAAVPKLGSELILNFDRGDGGGLTFLAADSGMTVALSSSAIGENTQQRARAGACPLRDSYG